MLKRRCIRPPWSSATVNIRYASGSANEVPDLISAKCSNNQISASGTSHPRRNMADVTAMIETETGEVWNEGRPITERLVTTLVRLAGTRGPR